MKITAAKNILQLIEKADKDDLAAIINIEGAVWSLFHPLKNLTFLKALTSDTYKNLECIVFMRDDGETERFHPSVLEYACSLDAIKGLMLEEWVVTINQLAPNSFTAAVEVRNKVYEAGNSQTMELAWLFAVIRAHIWEWENE